MMDDMMVETKVAGKPALTDVSVKNRRPGVHADAGPDRVRGLYLRVSASRARYWFARLVVHGKRRDMGLGSYPEIGLAAGDLATPSGDVCP